LSNNTSESQDNRYAKRLDREIKQLLGELPGGVADYMLWLRKPSSRWLRYPIALILIAGAFFSFLPILGVWMLPLGLVLLAQDIPFLQRPVLRLLVGIRKFWAKWRPRRWGK
jgi:hypothetical protein